MYSKARTASKTSAGLEKSWLAGASGDWNLHGQMKSALGIAVHVKRRAGSDELASKRCMLQLMMKCYYHRLLLLLQPFAHRFVHQFLLFLLLLFLLLLFCFVLHFFPACRCSSGTKVQLTRGCNAAQLVDTQAGRQTDSQRHLLQLMLLTMANSVVVVGREYYSTNRRRYCHDQVEKQKWHSSVSQVGDDQTEECSALSPQHQKNAFPGVSGDLPLEVGTR